MPDPLEGKFDPDAARELADSSDTPWSRWVGSLFEGDDDSNTPLGVNLDGARDVAESQSDNWFHKWVVENMFSK